MPRRNPDMCWKVHVPGLLQEIVGCSNQPILKIPLNMFRLLLSATADRASELNDPQLNALMCKMGLYAIADPYDKENYDPKRVTKILREADRIQRLQAKQSR